MSTAPTDRVDRPSDGPLKTRPASPQQGNFYGIIAILLTMTCFVTNDTVTKLAGSNLPAGELIAVRGLFSLVLLIGLCVLTGQHRRFRLAFNKVVILRSLFETAGSIFFLLALLQLPIANVTAVLMIIPLATTAGAALLLKEEVGIRRWSAIFVGFLGVVIIVRPGLSGFNAWSLFALCAVFVAAGRDLSTRFLPPNPAIWVVTLTTMAYSTLGGFAMGLFEDWKVPQTETILYLAGASAFLTAGHFLVVVAMKSGDMAVVTSFRYVNIIVALIYGYLLWGEVPDIWTWLGIGLILAAGLYTISRERRLARAARAAR